MFTGLFTSANVDGSNDFFRHVSTTVNSLFLSANFVLREQLGYNKALNEQVTSAPSETSTARTGRDVQLP